MEKINLTFKKNIDSQGRIVIPKEILDEISTREFYVIFDVEKNEIILKPIEK